MKKLRKAGFESVFLPLITIKPLKKKFHPNYDWLLVTSANAARAMAPFLKRNRSLKVAAVGPATAGVLKKIGIKPKSPKRSAGAASLLSFFKKQKIRGKRFLYPTSNLASDALKKGLEKMGGKVEQVAAYRTVPQKGVSVKLRRIFKKRIDGVLFFSPSGVKNFPKRLAKNIPMIPFGKTTAQAMRARGFKPAFIPSQSNETIFIRELKKYFSGFRLSPE
ncbi:MAG: uroporphyrinogen-III synthase [Deltaproteobacteria bacterium]|nr:uroporphyrinogen-III synthase [Deltaproteobacteria bacterium]